MKQVIDEILVEATILGMMRDASSDYEQYDYQQMPGIGNKDVRISTVLGYKTHQDFKTHSQK